MFGKKKEKSNVKAAQLEAARRAALNPKTKITVMPEKFWLPEEKKKKFWTAGKVWSVVIVSLVILIAAVYLLLSSGTNQAEQSQNIQSETSAPALLPTENAAELVQPTESITEDITTEVTPVENVETTTEPAEAAPLPPRVAPLSLDQDGDGLTDVEESIYGTDTQLIDSDNDTFIDGVEVKGGYNPAGTGRLVDNGVFTQYSNTAANYSFAYPSDWQLVTTGQQGVQLVTGNGEVVLVLLQSKNSDVALLDWYKQVTGITDDTKIQTKVIGNTVGILTDDERTFYFTLSSLPNVVFVVNHAIGSKAAVDYSTTVEAIIASFK